MKTDELQRTLNLIAGPPPSATERGLEAVHRRVRSARIRTWAITSVAVIAVVAVVSVLVVRNDAPGPHVEVPAGPGLSTPQTSVVHGRIGPGLPPEHPVETCVEFTLSSLEHAKPGSTEGGRILVYDRGIGSLIEMDVTTYCTGAAKAWSEDRAAGRPSGSVIVENGQVRTEQVPDVPQSNSP